MPLKNQIRRIQSITGGAQSVAVGTLAITFFTLISKIMGFVREMVLAARFGTSWRLDAVIIAMEPAQNISAIIAGALGTMMIPIYLDIKREGDPQKNARYVSQLLKISSLILFVFSAALFFFPDILIRVFAPSYSGEILEFASRKLQQMAVLPLINGFGTLFTNVLQAERRFIQMALFPLLFNIIAIPLLFFLAPFWGESAYVFAWIVGQSFMVLVVGLYCWRFFDKKEVFSTRKIQPQASKTMRLAIPLIAGSSSGTFNNIIDKVFASFLPAGRISALRYSQTLLAMINALIIGSFMTTTYTEIAEAAARNDKEAIKSRLQKTNTDMMNLVIPLTFWVMLMAEPLIRVLFERGAFDIQSTELVSVSLIGYSLIIMISPISGLIFNTLLVLKDVRFMNILAFVSIGLNALLDWVLLNPFGHMGIALSTTGVSLFSTLFCYLWLRKRHRIHFIDKRIGKPLLLTFPIFMVLFWLKDTHIHQWVWTGIGNLSFMVLFGYLNRSMISTLIRRIRAR